jgi:hypothetical protein
LEGILDDPNGGGSWGYSDIWMPTYDSSYYSGQWRSSLLQIPGNEWWSIVGWKDSALPKMQATFDAYTANFTLSGDVAAQAFLRSNDTDYIGGSEGELGTSIQGTIQFTFNGALDAYHSDELNMNTSSATWLRTVGFGNNSLNIRNSAAGRLGPSLGATTMIIMFSMFVLFY